MAFRLPRGKDLSVPIALLPWWAFEVEFGLSVKISEALMILLIARHFFSGRLRIASLPGIGCFAAFMGLSLLVAAVTIEFGPDVPAFAGGNVMRNGYGRVATTFFKTIILFGFMVLISTNRKRVSPFLLLKSYVYSCVALAALGLLQMTIFLVQGIDIFPIAMFQGEEYVRSGMVSIHGESFLRISSLGGEPKGLGQALAVALCILMIFTRRFAMSRWSYIISAMVLLLVVILTSSTSAYITLLVVAGFIFTFTRDPRPYSRWRIQMTLCLIAGTLVSVFYTQAAYTDTLSQVTYTTFDSYWDSIVYKLTTRVRLDDTDSMVMESFVDAPLGLFFGRGLGVVHHYAHSFMPPHIARYMRGSIVVPKSGISNYLGDAGLLGMFLTVLMLSRFVPAADQEKKHRTRIPTRLMTGMQALAFGLFAALLLRLYTRDIIWVTFACMSVIDYQIQHGMISSGRTLPGARRNIQGPAVQSGSVGRPGRRRKAA